MKSLYRLVLVIALFAGLLVLLNYQSGHGPEEDVHAAESAAEAQIAVATTTPRPPLPGEVVICVVACGDNRVDETLTMLKSALVFTKRPMRFIVISDYAQIPAFHERLTEWRQLTNGSFDFIVRPVTFPETGDTAVWRKLFKPCAAQRLFLPNVLNDTDAILYVDTDTLFLAPPELVWDKFKEMNKTQFAALSPESEDPNTGWYNRFAKHPFYGKLGVNSGVMLMNLTRMREFRWMQYVIPIYQEYKLKIIWGDQDIINIIFHYHPERLYVYNCRYNYRPDHCMYMPVCPEAEKDGALVIHGSRGTFHAEKQPPFKAVFTAMQEYQLNTDPYDHLLLPMRGYLTVEDSSPCGKLWKVFNIQPELHLGRTSLLPAGSF
ncbi:hypothetical protein QAD02_024055 [Eretmocerus hayati]|uniref:Uncharacterized protein n=1 Tax=Eretmocerus hayati TaxID=131215 RepID=A0ACC2Q2G1_9HYME|nr:hypothetical protein QAD02_024055 [Eretmocerus hayati]